MPNLRSRSLAVGGGVTNKGSFQTGFSVVFSLDVIPAEYSGLAVSSGNETALALVNVGGRGISCSFVVCVDVLGRRIPDRKSRSLKIDPKNVKIGGF